jgi:penicillin-binding protein
MKKKTIIMSLIGLIAVIGIAGGGFFYYRWHQQQAELAAVKTTAKAYTSAFQKRNYTQMAKSIDTTRLTGKDYKYTPNQVIARNEAVFTRVGASQIKINRVTVTKKSDTNYQLHFNVVMQTALGKLNMPNYETAIRLVNNHWRVVWSPAMLFPQMTGKSTVQLSRITPKRGEILDRNGDPLAENGGANEAGMVRGKLGTGQARTDNLNKISTTFGVSVADLEKLLNQSWVTDDNFVPIKTVTNQTALTGVAYQAVTRRSYPTGEASAQLIGYVGAVTAEDLKKHPELAVGDEIGKTGLERYYNKELQGQAGGDLTINNNGIEAHSLIQRDATDGHNVKLTIDRAKQVKAYQQLNGKKGSVVTMDPKNGQILTLVSSPSYDPNKFVTGISQSDYNQYANNADHPFVSRFAQGYAPGSTFKMITAGIALDNGTITPNTTRAIAGLKWRKDSSWGSYQVTRVENVATENMTQALVHSDNIWFAQTALQMGSAAFLKGVTPFVNQKDDLPLTMTKAQISNDGKLSREVLLADTAYGQGQLLLSPVQQAVAYSAIADGGKMQLPTLLLSKTAGQTTVLKESSAAAVKTALTQVVSDPAGTAHSLQISGHTIAAKTGTAELKATQDTNGPTNGFLMALDADNNSYLMVAMMEDAGSDTVVNAMKPYVASLY